MAEYPSNLKGYVSCPLSPAGIPRVFNVERTRIVDFGQQPTVGGGVANIATFWCVLCDKAHMSVVHDSPLDFSRNRTTDDHIVNEFVGDDRS